jgi:hypothetical protein
MKIRSRSEQFNLVAAREVYRFTLSIDANTTESRQHTNGNELVIILGITTSFNECA